MMNEQVINDLAKIDPLPEHKNHKEIEAIKWAFEQIRDRWTDPPLKLIDSSPPLSSLRYGIYNDQFIRLPEIERLAQDPDSIHLANLYIQRHLEETAKHRAFLSKSLIWQLLHPKIRKQLSISLKEERRTKKLIEENIMSSDEITFYEFQFFWRYIAKLGLFTVFNSDGTTTEIIRKPEYMHEFE